RKEAVRQVVEEDIEKEDVWIAGGELIRNELCEAAGPERTRKKRGQIDVNMRIRAIELMRIFTRLGPTFVKLGQGLTTRPDLCPSEYLEELSEHQVYAKGQNARRFKKLYADKEDVLVSSAILGNFLNMDFFMLTLILVINLLATPKRKLGFHDFRMMCETPEEARFAIIGHVVQIVSRDYEVIAREYYVLDFLSVDVDVSPIVPVLHNFFDDALTLTVSELSFKILVDGLGVVLYQYPFNGKSRLLMPSHSRLVVLVGFQL
ncbi:hypothetical protein GIB67_012509, partial [Kingdonia uniflora]